MLLTRLYESAQIRQLESIAMEQFAIHEDELMARAGLAAFTTLKQQWPQAKKIAVICGGGNNGGDGYVVARLAHQHGLDVKIYYLGNRNQLQGPAKQAQEASVSAAVPLDSLTALLGQYPKPEDLLTVFSGADVIVDAMLGIGLQGEVRDDYATTICALNLLDVPVLSLDTPSGLDVDTGCVLGHAVEATATVTFIAMKRGLLTAQGPDYCGAISCHDLQIPAQAFDEVGTTLQCLEHLALQEHLKARKPSAHKGNYGHVVVLGGDYGMPGAVRLAAEAAYRAGAGLVSVVTHPEHIALVSGMRAEIMCHGDAPRAQLKQLLQRASAIVVGPGLGRSRWSKRLLKLVLRQTQPLVIDADALNLIAQHPQSLDHCILSPHPGEAARLLATDISRVQQDRFAAVRQLQQRYGGVSILKGVGTLIHDGQQSYLCNVGNPGMASGGMGDVLSGIMGGLLAQSLSLSAAAQLGVSIHAQAGDKAAEQLGQRGLLAGDLMPYIHQLVNPRM